MNKLPSIDSRVSLISGKDGIYSSKGVILKDYQEEGCRWMFSQEANGTGGLLADEPGLGKTYQSIALIASDPDSLNLIVVPSSTLPQWKKDAIMFCGEDSVYLHHGLDRQVSIPNKTRIVLTTPQTLFVSGHLHDKYNRSYVNLHEIYWDRIVIDEVHCIKNPNSNTSKRFMKLLGRFKWGLSGTPIQNTEAEIKNLFKFVTNTRYNDVLPRSLNDLLDHNTGLILRRKKVDKLTLPPVEIENHEVDFHTEAEKEFYLKVKRNVRDEFLFSQGMGSVGDEMAIMMELLLRLRQTVTHPQLVIDGYRRKYVKTGVTLEDAKREFPDWMGGISTKHQTMLDLISKHPKDNSIIFSQFTQEMNILQKLFTQNGYDVARIDGSLSQLKKAEVIARCQGPTQDIPTIIKNKLGNNIDRVIDSFLNKRPQILLIQIKAGGVGLNLQSYNRVYITSPDWNPANEDQAIARSWRMGQNKKVYVKRIVLNDIDEKTSVIDSRILSIQENKRELQSKLLQDESLSCNGKRSKGRGLSRRDLSRLLK